jgi:hypothetical protein
VSYQCAIVQEPVQREVSTELPGHRRFTLADIVSHQDINSLTVRQMKEILVNNYVDFRGCCERQELVDRVHRLWTDNERRKLVG